MATKAIQGKHIVYILNSNMTLSDDVVHDGQYLWQTSRHFNTWQNTTTTVVFCIGPKLMTIDAQLNVVNADFQ